MDAKQIRGLRPKLRRYLSRFDDCFARKDTRGHLPKYVEGQLSDLPRKSVEPIALKSGVPVRTLQEFLSQHEWDHDRMVDRVQEIVRTEHASPHSIGIFDETSFVKKGAKTPGVQRQYCGAVGKQENCIVTVHLNYAAGDFHCLLDGELFLPESWSNDRDRCREAGIPDENGLPVGPYHLLIWRDVLKPDEIKYFISNASPETAVHSLLRVAFSRWRIERCFEDQKGEVGLDHYEGRRYLGLKRHLAITAVSYLFLAQTRQALVGEKPGADGLPSAHGSGGIGERLVA